jgi:hypothetical protein
VPETHDRKPWGYYTKRDERDQILGLVTEITDYARDIRELCGELEEKLQEQLRVDGKKTDFPL